MAKILALDVASAKPVAYALWEDGRLKAFGLVDVIDLMRMLRKSKPLTVVMEHMYYNSRKSVQSLISLVKAAGAIEYAAVEGGHDVVEVYASEWQAKVLPIVREKQWTSREERRRWAMMIAQQLVREHLGEEKEINEDEAVAICLGHYVSSREEFRQMVEERREK